MNIQEFKENLDSLKLCIADQTESPLTTELNQLVLAGGKKFRPGLLFLMGKVFEVPHEELTIYARAAELTHLASLIHDDVIDSSDKRRNHPTLNSLKNNTTAILAGDFVLATIMGELAQNNKSELLIDLTKVIKDLADGEWLQFELKSKESATLSDLEKICIKKTGSLIRYCCTTPAKLAGYNDIETMGFLGERIGLIFQMADDIMDGFTQTGRPAFQDITNGQFNYVSLKLIELYPELKDSLHALKNNLQKSIPWSQEQYRQAINAVDEMINFEKDRIFTIFTHLARKKNCPELIPLFELMINRIQSHYSTVLQ